MEREEIEAMWERIKALEENALKVCKALGQQSMTAIYAQMGASAGLKGKAEAYSAYMGPKLKEARQHISDAQDIDGVIAVVQDFNTDCISFVHSLVVHG